MTKKDYELIAESLNAIVSVVRIPNVSKQEMRFAVNEGINLLARDLQNDNPRFDFDKFIKAVNK
jgi:hypothetical protein